MSSSVSAVCDRIGEISAETTQPQLVKLASECEAHLGKTSTILDAVENSLSVSTPTQRLVLWYFVDRLAKQHEMFLDAIRSKIILWGTKFAPPPGTRECDEFVNLLRVSFTPIYGDAVVTLILTQLGLLPREQTSMGAGTAVLAAPTAGLRRTEQALVKQQAALRTFGSFVTKGVTVARPQELRHKLLVKKNDSEMAMAVASSYAPARPVELAVPQRHADADAPRGHMKALPADHMARHIEERRKRLRDVMEHDRAAQEQRDQEELLRKVRKADRTDTDNDTGLQTAGTAAGAVTAADYSDVIMPRDLPRDEYGVRMYNFPRGVRFLKRAIESCGGAVELEVLVNRVASLADRTAVSQFGQLREFLLVHSPTFALEREEGTWVVRLRDDKGEAAAKEPTWKRMVCPLCSKVVRGRNFARHLNCRTCIKAQISAGLHGEFADKGPIAELAANAKSIIVKGDKIDDWDLDVFTDSIGESAQVRRFRLASPKSFAPVLKALRTVRDVWLRRKNASCMNDVVVDATDASFAACFRVFGESIHRLPILWIEMGDVIDMCHRFSTHTLPPFHPPPRPADPRINLDNEYAGFLLCESEIDEEDFSSDAEGAFSDDEAPTFTFAPPVETAETLFTAGFPRDTKRLQHRMRTAPPMPLQSVLHGDGNQTQMQMFADISRAQNSAPR